MPVEITRRRRSGARGGDARAVRRAVEATLAYAEAVDREVSVLLTNDAEIRQLNADWRGLDKPTDVLAFALDEADSPAGPIGLIGLIGLTGLTGPTGPLGDVIVSVERAEAQARTRGVTLDAELELLVVHGTLHLLGHDHATSEDAKAMRNATRAVRRRLARRR